MAEFSESFVISASLKILKCDQDYGGKRFTLRERDCARGSPVMEEVKSIGAHLSGIFISYKNA